MKFCFDHLVQYVNSSALQTVETLRDNGLHGVVGGHHEAFGTYNSLCYFDLSYIEYLGLENAELCAEQAETNSFLRQLLTDLPKGEGFGTVALRTHQIEQVAAHMARQGVKMTGPFPGRRKRPDGSVLSWQMLLLESEASGVPMPFVIQWEQSDEERRADHLSRGIAARHPLGKLTLRYVAYATVDLDRTLALWERWYGFAAEAAYFDGELNARCRRVPLMGGDLLLCSPTGPGVVADVLAQRGERPFLAAFSGADNTQERKISGGRYRFL